MKIAIVYSSTTGNTEKIAETIKNCLNADDICYYGKPKKDIEADVYLVGSWTFRGDCTQDIATFLSSLKHKKIAYFGTAGFGGSEEYYQTLFNRTMEKIDDSNILLGYFFCQGKMPMSVREKYVTLLQEHPEDKKLQVSLDNFDEALKHPNEKDFKDVQDWIKNILKIANKS